MFCGRDQEMAELNSLYVLPGFQMPVIYGRRRVGKTRLIQEFCQDKDAVFYLAIEQNDAEALRLFTDSIKQRSQKDETLKYLESFASWQDALNYLGEKGREERLVVVIDEYPYLVNTNKSFPSILQGMIDQVFMNTQLFLILCGSSMHFMENEVLNYKSPLYGRRTAQMKVRPLDYFDSTRFLSHWAKEEQLFGYSVAGGIPPYLLALGRYADFQTAVTQTLLRQGGYLYEEPVNLMKQEMREPAVYNSIIRAIAGGASRQSDIANRVGELPSKVAVYLRALLDLEIVERVYPLGDTSKSKVIYRISDNLYAFWFKFIPRAMGMIEMGMSDTAWTQLVQPYFSDYFGNVFEMISRQYLIRLNRAKRLPHVYHTFGKWWGTNPSTHQQEEIDIVAESPQAALFAECKWTKEMVGTSVLDTLRRRSLLTQNGKDRSYYLFSRSGFSKELQHSTGNDVCLVMTEDILNIPIV